ncbi:MAG: His/Gly/Thr/Pro-type tRNA ligase C-terminal domain-containing protein [Patescibacteria group bacterium]
MKKQKKTITPKESNTAYSDIDTAAEVAVYYGFTPQKTPTIKKDDMAQAKHIESADEKKALPLGWDTLSLEGQSALIREYVDNNWHNLPQPLTHYHKGPFAIDGKPAKKESREMECYLEIIGTHKSIAEAIIIETAIAILKEEGYDDLHLEINSIGDRESFSRFTKELTAYYRKHINDLPAACRQAMKSSVFSLLSCSEHETCKKLAVDAPQSISFLSEASRHHFQEILEYLETLDIPYTIQNLLVGNPSFSSGPVFEIRNDGCARGKGVAPLAVGCRYDGLAKKLGAKKEILGACAVLHFKKPTGEKANHKVKKPEVYFIQLGFEAKLKSLKVIEVLRQAKIPVHQALCRDRMATQIAIAEKSKVPFLLIMGLKEAMENAVIVRDMTDRSQNTIKIEDVPAYLKKLKAQK